MDTWFSHDDDLGRLKKQLSQKDIRCANLQVDLDKKNSEYEELKLTLKEANWKLQQEADRATKLEEQLTRKTTELQREKITRQNAESALDITNEKLNQEKKALRLVELELDNYALHNSGSSGALAQLTKERDELKTRLSQAQLKAQTAVDLQDQLVTLRAENARLQGGSSNPFQSPSRSRLLSRTPGRPRSSSTCSDIRISRLEQDNEHLRSTTAHLEATNDTMQKKLSKANTDLIAMENAKIAVEKTSKREIDALKDQMEDARDEIAALKYYLEEADGGRSVDIGPMKKRIADLEKQIEEKDKAVGQLQAAMDQAGSQQAELNSRIASLQSQLEQSRQAALAVSTATNSPTEPEQPQLARSTASKSVRMLTRDLAAAQREKAALQAELETMDETIANKEEEIESLRAKVAQVSSSAPSAQPLDDRKLKETEESLAHVTAQLDALQSERAKAADDLAAARGEIDSLQRDLEQAGRSLSIVQDQLEGARDETRQAITQLEALRAEHQAHLANPGPSADDIARLEALLVEKESDISELQYSLESERSELEVLSAHKSDLENELREVKRSLEEMETAAAAAEEVAQDLEEARWNLGKMEESNADAISETVSLRGALEKKDRELQQQLDDASASSFVLQNRLSATEASLSQANTKIAELTDLYDEAVATAYERDAQISELEEQVERQSQEMQKAENLLEKSCSSPSRPVSFPSPSPTASFSLSIEKRSTLSSNSSVPELTLEDLTVNREGSTTSRDTTPSTVKTISSSSASMQQTPISSLSATTVSQSAKSRSPRSSLSTSYDRDAIVRILDAVDRLRMERDHLRDRVYFLELETKFGATPGELRKAEEIERLKKQVEETTRAYEEKTVEHATALSGKEQEKATLSSQLVEAEAALEQANEDLENGRAELERLENEAAASLATVSAQAGELNALRDAGLAAQTQLRSEIGGLQDQLRQEAESHQQQVADNDTQLSAVRSQRDKLEQQVTSLQEKVIGLTSYLDQVKAKYSEASSQQLNNLSESEAVARLRQDNEDLKARVGRREDQITMHQHDIKRNAMNLRLAEDSVEEMKVDLEELQTRLLEVQGELACVKEDNETVRNEREGDKKIILALDEERETLEEQVAQAKQSIEGLQGEISDMRDASRRSEAARSTEVATLVGLLFTLQARTKSLSSKLAKSRTAAEQLRRDVSEGSRQDLELQEELRYTLVELDTVKAELASQSDEVTALRKKETALKAEVATGRTEISQLGQELSSKVSAYDQLVLDRDHLSAVVGQLREEQTAQLELYASLEEKLAESDNLGSQDQLKLQQLEAAVEEATQERDDLSAKVDQWQSKHEELSAQLKLFTDERDRTVSALEARLAEMDGQLSADSQDIAALVKEGEELRDEIATLQTQLEDVEFSRKQEQDERQGDQAQMETLGSELADARAKNQQLLRNVETLEVQVAQSNESLSGLAQSRSEVERLRHELDWCMKDRQNAVTRANESAERADDLERLSLGLQKALREANSQPAAPSSDILEEIESLKEQLVMAESDIQRKNEEIEQHDDQLIEMSQKITKLTRINESLARKLAKKAQAAAPESVPVAAPSPPTTNSRPSPATSSEPKTATSEPRRPLSSSTNLALKSQEPIMPANASAPRALGLRLPPAKALARSAVGRSLPSTLASQAPRSIAVSEPLVSQNTPVLQRVASSSATINPYASPSPLQASDSPSSIGKKRAREDDDDMLNSPQPALPIVAPRRTPASAKRSRRSPATGSRSSAFTPARGAMKEEVPIAFPSAPSLSMSSPKAQAALSLPPRPRLAATTRLGDALPVPTIRTRLVNSSSLKSRFGGQQRP